MQNEIFLKASDLRISSLLFAHDVVLLGSVCNHLQVALGSFADECEETATTPTPGQGQVDASSGNIYISQGLINK